MVPMDICGVFSIFLVEWVCGLLAFITQKLGFGKEKMCYQGVVRNARTNLLDLSRRLVAA